MVIVLWLPVSLFSFAWSQTHFPQRRGVMVQLREGGLRVQYSSPASFGAGVRGSGFAWISYSFRYGVRPYSVWYFDPQFRVTEVSLPLWLLAAICLAWPVTSFILARRKRKRGFPVEPKPSRECRGDWLTGTRP
jgi:hypothetical protein